MERPSIKSFQDLVIYQSTYQAMLNILTQIITKLPKDERYDLIDQMRRACKAPPALIAEGFAKRYQKRHWHLYLTNAMGECYEMINHLSVCRDIYREFVDPKLCNKLIEDYEIVCKQITKLSQSWTNYHDV